MPEPFWQRSLPDLTYTDVGAFVENRIPEGDHIEYKKASLNQDGKFYVGKELLETVVAFANTGGGMLFIGVEEDGQKRPTSIEGIPVTNPRKPMAPRRDLEESVRSACSDQIEPAVLLEVKPLDIPDDGGDAEKQVLLVRVRHGRQTPYNLRKVGMYVRDADADRIASVREVAELFARRGETAGLAPTLWSRTWQRTFTHETMPPAPTVAPFLMIALAPAFPLEPITLDAKTDWEFQSICAILFGEGHYLFREPDGIILDFLAHGHGGEHPPYACATADGSISVRDSIAPFFQGDTERPKPLGVDLVGLWKSMRHILTIAQRWPRDVCGYGGPLLCRLALGNLYDTIAAVPTDVFHSLAFTSSGPIIPNRAPSWSADVEWDRGQDCDDVIGQHLASLSRQLQFGHYPSLKDRIRAEATR
jgi:hypothetical protein